MKLSHLHVSFGDLAAASDWIKRVLGLEPIEEGAGAAVYRFGDVDLVMHGDWGDGETSFTLALASGDCLADYERAVLRGARPRTPPRDKGTVIGADVHGPGRMVVEWEQVKGGADDR